MLTIEVALLKAEWNGHDVTDKPAIVCCPVCGAHKASGTHEPNCELDLALAERGYGTQAERETARERIKMVSGPTLPPPSVEATTPAPPYDDEES